MRTLFFDTETTSKLEFNLSHEAEVQPDIIQLAAILRDVDGREMCSINYYMQTDRKIDPGAAAVNGITQEVTELFGVSAVNGLYVFRDMLASAEAVVAHNIGFDRTVVNTGLFRNSIPEIPWDKLIQRDTMKAAINIVRAPFKNGRSGFKFPSLKETYFHFFKEEFDGAHDAMVDVRACMRVYDELLRINAFPDVMMLRKENA